MDATNLERNFFLTLQLLESGKPMVVVLNMWDCAQSKGVYLDLPSLSQALGVPVVTLTAVSGEGLKELVGVMGDSLKKTDQYQSKLSKMNDEERWAIIGQVIPRVQKIEHRHPTLLQRLERASVHPSTDF
ncbi:MAG: ferrous iron transporter B, partial [Methanobacteriaceae archaeon]|nr:ferrous iron transporter B [Methanobacteriaceae archaeon]